MIIDTDDIKQVLALFDKEDIPYINFEYLIRKNILKNDNEKSKDTTLKKTKKIGGKNDRPRK